MIPSVLHFLNYLALSDGEFGMSRRSAPNNVTALDVRRRLKARTSLILLACFEGQKDYQPWIGSSF